jgi:hypothetical protein
LINAREFGEERKHYAGLHLHRFGEVFFGKRREKLKAQTLRASTWLQSSSFINKSLPARIRVPTRCHRALDRLNQPAIRNPKTLMLRHVPVASPVNSKLQK